MTDMRKIVVVKTPRLTDASFHHEMTNLARRPRVVIYCETSPDHNSLVQGGLSPGTDPAIFLDADCLLAWAKDGRIDRFRAVHTDATSARAVEAALAIRARRRLTYGGVMVYKGGHPIE